MSVRIVPMDLVIGVVGATGAVGQTALDILGDLPAVGVEGFRAARVRAFASRSSAGKKVDCGGVAITVEATRPEALAECDALLFATDAHISKDLIPAAARAGVLCVDKSSAYREDPEVPLAVPEVNPHRLEPAALSAFPVVANPNCCATPLAVVLAPLLETYGVERVIVSTYQSVSGTGKQGIDVLNEETRAFLRAEDLADKPSGVYPKSIAFNVMPFVARILPSGDTDEEAKIIAETRRILERPDLRIAATSVRVPTFVGHAESVTVELGTKATLAQVRALLASSPGINFVDEFAPARTGTEDDAEDAPSVAMFPTPREVHGTDPVHVGRVRPAPVFENGFSLWIAADNLRKGAALNAIQIIDACSRNGTIVALRSRRR